MWWWWLAITSPLWILWIAILVRAAACGEFRTHYSDGCARPIVDRAVRTDGSRKHIIPRRGDAEIDDLEHLLEHHR